MTRRGRGRPPHPGILTTAEQRVLEELRRGGTNAEIAARLGVTLDAVKFHISNMLGKLQLENREQLAAWRPEPRRRLFGLLALPAALEPVGRVLVWAGVAAVGAAAVAVVAVVLIVLSSLDGGEQQLALAPTATATLAATATPTPAPAVTPAVCKTSADPTCIRAVYLGAPGDYAQVADIPAGVLLTPDADGRYRVERGQQYTVVTAAPLPAGWTRFWLERTPSGSPPAVSASQLIQPVGTTYTFTVTDDEAASTLITFELKQARLFIRPRPDGKPEIGATVVTTEFLVPRLRYNRLDTTGAAATAGSYAFLTAAGDAASATQEFSRVSRRAVELRIHPADASGTSRATFYDTVKIGDTLDYRTLGLDCGFRFKVTSVTSTATPRSFGIERVRAYGHWCGSLEGDPGAARDVTFVWGVRTGLPGTDGVRVMLLDEPTGQGTYRIARDLPWVIDIPAGAEIVFEGILIIRPWSAGTCRVQPRYSWMWGQDRGFTSTPRRAGTSTASSPRMRRIPFLIRSSRRSGAWSRCSPRAAVSEPRLRRRR